MSDNQSTFDAIFGNTKQSKPSKYIRIKDLGQATTNNDYKFKITLERCRWNDQKYIVITRYIQDNYDKSIGIPVNYAGAVGSLLTQAYLRYAHGNNGGNAPTEIENLKW